METPQSKDSKAPSLLEEGDIVLSSQFTVYSLEI